MGLQRIFILTAVAALVGSAALGGGIFGGSSESAFGGSSSTFLTKATSILAVAFMVLALLVALCNRGSGDNVVAFAEQSQTEAGTTWLESDSVSTETVAPAEVSESAN